jgi:hypothetical protein
LRSPFATTKRTTTKTLRSNISCHLTQNIIRSRETSIQVLSAVQLENASLRDLWRTSGHTSLTKSSSLVSPETSFLDQISQDSQSLSFDSVFCFASGESVLSSSSSIVSFVHSFRDFLSLFQHEPLCWKQKKVVMSVEQMATCC